MPSYKVKAKGYMFGRLYDPNGKRRVVTTDAPLKPVPSWLEAPVQESASAIKARKAAEKKAAEANKQKAEQDKKDIDAVTFTEAPAPSQSNVETL